jgi:hypothetical protein
MFDQDELSITPVNFFQLAGECVYLPIARNALFSMEAQKKPSQYLLPSSTSLTSEDSFADLKMGWNEEGVELVIELHTPFTAVRYPDLQRGDSVELFFDTRDLKTSGFNTRFCHHFYFLPEAIEGHMAGELTRFRTEDTHPLCDPADLKVRAQFQKNGYQMHLMIPAHCLHGYDPEQFERLGFTYRINRVEGPSQHFALVSDDYPIEQHASLWASLRLIK